MPFHLIKTILKRFVILFLPVFFPLTFFEYGSRLAQMLKKHKTARRRRTLIVRTSGKPAVFDDADGPRWTVSE
jgi:hypothetical protein